MGFLNLSRYMPGLHIETGHDNFLPAFMVIFTSYFTLLKSERNMMELIFNLANILWYFLFLVNGNFSLQ
jgi:hypothetical protein